MDKAGNLTASLEDYIEVIFNLALEKDAVRSKDIAERLDVSRPSVTGALKALSKEGLIEHKPYEYIKITKAGIAKAKSVIERHNVLKRFFTSCLDVSEMEAEKAACLMEHSMSGNILKKMSKFINNYENSRNE